jgi:hypothetical protein
MIPLTRHLEKYLELRHRLGFKLRDATFELRKFVRFAQKARASYVTTKLALDWATQPTGCQPARYGNRLSMLRGFAEYLSAVDPRTEVPPAGLLLVLPQNSLLVQRPAGRSFNRSRPADPFA